MTGISINKNEFLNQFNELNAHIETALEMHDFDRARRIDIARRQMLQEFTSKSMPDGDKVFFDTLERCAADNARAITNITSEIDRMRREASRKMRQLNGYRASRSQSKFRAAEDIHRRHSALLLLSLTEGRSIINFFIFSIRVVRRNLRAPAA